jgi:hypothetical protein
VNSIDNQRTMQVGHIPVHALHQVESLRPMLKGVVQAAAEAAGRAQTAAEAARVQAAAAKASVEATARDLLVAKRSEIEAAEMLEKTKNPKDADPAAAEIVKVGQLP